MIDKEKKRIQKSVSETRKQEDEAFERFRENPESDEFSGAQKERFLRRLQAE